MRIARCQVYRYRLPLARPLTTATRPSVTRDGFLLRLHTSEGHYAWGEVAPLPGFSTESIDQVLPELRKTSRAIVGTAIAVEIVCIDEILTRLPVGAEFSPSVRCGLEMALLSLSAVAQGKTLSKLLSPQSSSTIDLNGLITDSGDAVSEALRLAGMGYNTLKLKVGRRPMDSEIEAVRAVRRAVGSNIALRLDANRAWDYEQAARLAARLRDVGIEYIEEPCRSLDESLSLMRDFDIPVALDESLTTMSTEQLNRVPAPAALVLKPTLLGGFGRCVDLARIADIRGAKTVISSSFETSVGIAALAQLAAACGSPGVAHGLDTLSYLAEDVTVERLTHENGRISIEEAWRVARRVDEARLTQVYDTDDAKSRGVDRA